MGALEDFAAKAEDVQIVFMGDGEKQYKVALQRLEKAFPRKIRYRTFNSDFEKRLTAYADFFVNTPWYEPSGTNQLFAMKNGTIPIVTRVGGLADFVADGKTALLIDLVLKADQFETDNEKSRTAVLDGVLRALKLYRDDPGAILKMRQAAMSQDNSWTLRMPVYDRLFSFIRNNGRQVIQREGHRLDTKMESSTEIPIELLLSTYEDLLSAKK